MANRRRSDDDDMEANREMGKRLFIMRKKLGKSQEVMAEIFDVSLSSYKRWEIEGPKNYPLKFWKIYAEVEAKVEGVVKSDYHDTTVNFFIGLFKRLSKGDS